MATKRERLRRFCGVESLHPASHVDSAAHGGDGRDGSQPCPGGNQRRAGEARPARGSPQTGSGAGRARFHSQPGVTRSRCGAANTCQPKIRGLCACSSVVGSCGRSKARCSAKARREMFLFLHMCARPAMIATATFIFLTRSPAARSSPLRFAFGCRSLMVGLRQGVVSTLLEALLFRIEAGQDVV